VILRRTPKIFPRNGTKKIMKKRQCGRRLHSKTAKAHSYIHTYVQRYVYYTCNIRMFILNGIFNF
jgi:hypothetical protein